MASRYSIDPDIARAETLPASFYRSRAVYDELLERVFARSWQWIGHAAELEAEEARPSPLLEGSLDEPLMLTRDADGELRCLSNVCTHRGNLLLQERGSCTRIRCGYHGRTFTPDGRFVHMPEFEGARDFPRAADDLPRLQLESLTGALFTSLAPSTGFAEWTAQVRPLVERLPVGEFAYDAERSAVYDVNCHWAIYVENFLEGFHIPYVHPELARVLDDKAYRYELDRWSNVQVGLARAGESSFDAAQTVAGEDAPVAAYYYWLFPSTMLNFYPWGLSLNVVEPLGLERTRVRFVSYVGRPELLDVGAGGALDLVQRQDEEIVERVQRGLRSRFYDRGRFSPSRERCVHHFQSLLAAALE